MWNVGREGRSHIPSRLQTRPPVFCWVHLRLSTNQLTSCNGMTYPVVATGTMCSEFFVFRSGSESRGRWSAARRNTSPSSGVGPADTFPNSPSISPERDSGEDYDVPWEQSELRSAAAGGNVIAGNSVGSVERANGGVPNNAISNFGDKSDRKRQAQCMPGRLVFASSFRTVGLPFAWTSEVTRRSFRSHCGV